MPQDQRAQGPSVLSVPQYQAGEAVTYDYGWDVGNLHIIDHALHRAEIACTALFLARVRGPQLRIGRYLDGEEEREGLYR